MSLGSDLSLVPAGFDAVCAIPKLPIFDVTAPAYGAKGDNAADDTSSIRKALADAVAAGGGIVYLPAGIYKVCPQPGDVNPSGVWRPIFRINTSNVVFAGDGPGKTVLSCWYDGLTDPKTHWTVTTDGYVKITRFLAFGVAYDYQAKGSIDTFQVRSMTVNGNAGWTGSYEVGGDPTTGDGWDMGHKGIAVASPVNGGTLSNFLVFNSEICNFRGECIYAGAVPVANADIVSCSVYGSNSSAISWAEGCTIKSSALGGPDDAHEVYNGVENSCRTVGTANQFLDSTTQTKSNGFVHLGLPGTSLTIDGSAFIGNQKGILFSEAANNVVVRNSTFTNNQGCMIGSILGLYPNDPRGFANFDLHDNASTKSGALFIGQGTSIPGFLVRGNAMNSGYLLSGSFGPCPGFCVDGNTIGSGATDAGSYSGYAARWINTIRLPGSYVGSKNDTYAAEAVMILNPQIASDETILNAHPAGVTQAVAIDPKQLKFYPVGFMTSVYSTGGAGWTLKADPAWNTFAADVPVPAAPGVTIRKNTAGLFELAQ
jgi:hypothetical protein